MSHDPTPSPAGPKSSTRSTGDSAAPVLRIHARALGAYQTNCFLVESAGTGSDESGSAWLIDCGDEPGELLDLAEACESDIEAIILTHAHPDHIAGLHEARRRLGPVPIWIHEAEKDWLTDPTKNLSALMGQSVTGPAPDRLLHDGDVLTLGNGSWTVLHTPGHSPGGISLYAKEHGVVFVGDALFHGSIGRTDFPSSNHDQLLESIRDRLYPLPGSTRAFPGHGPETTIGHERLTNPYVRG